jgi:hypothetical protein
VELDRELQIPFSQQRLDKVIKDFDQDGDNALNFGEFLVVFDKGLQLVGTKTGSFVEDLRKHAALIKVAGARGEWVYSNEEMQGFADYVNNSLEQDPDLKGLLPIDGLSDALFKAVHDGILLCKLCNLASPDALDERVIATRKKLNIFSLLANITLALSPAKSLGLSIVSIGPPDIRDGTPHLVLGLVWQLMRLALMKSITLTEHSELYGLLKEGESLVDFLKFSPEEILLRWLNCGLKSASSSRVVTKFTKELSDSEILTMVLKSIKPECCTLAQLRQTDVCQRADGTLAEADKINCRKFVGANEIVQGHARLNLGFVASVFDTRLHFPTAFFPGLICIHPCGRYSNCLPPSQGETEGCANSMA